MPRNLTTFSILAIAGFLVACQANTPVTPVVETASHRAATVPSGITAQVRPLIKRAGERVLLADTNEWTVADVARLHVELWNTSLNTKKAEDDLLASNNELDDTLTFANLTNDTDYEVRAFAYLADDTTKISVDADSDLQFSVIRNEVLGNIGTLTVTLEKTAFGAGGTVPISIPSGGYSYDPDGETIENGPGGGL